VTTVNETVANAVGLFVETVPVTKVSLVPHALLIAANVRSILVVMESVGCRRRHAKIVKQTAASVVAPYAETVPVMKMRTVPPAPATVVNAGAIKSAGMVAVIFPSKIALAVVSIVEIARVIFVPMASAIWMRPV